MCQLLYKINKLMPVKVLARPWHTVGAQKTGFLLSAQASYAVEMAIAPPPWSALEQAKALNKVCSGLHPGKL